MKKIYLIYLLATILFISCEDEMISSIDSNIICFDNTFVEQSQTRAADITTNNLRNFYVHGWMTNAQGEVANIFNKEEVIKSSDGTWAYGGGSRFWFSNMLYEFLAFAPNTADYTLATDHQSLTFVNSGAYDFICATHTRTIGDKVPTSVDPVRLSFAHLLSKVVLKFENKFSAGDVTLHINDIRLSGPANQATFNLADTTWTITDETLVLTPTFYDAVHNRPTNDTSIVVGASATTEQFYIIPETITDADYQLQFKVTAWQGPEGGQVQIGTYHHSVYLDPMTFEVGKQYCLSAKFNSSNVNPDAALEPITFTVSVTPWGEDIQNEIF